MSPEQARGQKLDARSDIFSLGVMLYEILAGCPPFEGATTLEVVGAILHQEPVPLTHHLPDAADSLEHLVTKALAKDREQRYQTSEELLHDLRRVKEEFALHPPRKSAQRTPRDAAHFATATTAVRPALATRPGEKHVLSQFREWFKWHWRPVTLVLTLVLIATLATFFYFERNGNAVLTDKDTILLGGFRNRTGDEVFDGTLRQGLAVQLAQTPFLQIFSESRMRETLQQMGRSPDELVTPQIGREICERQGLKAVITGDIAALGTHYVLTLEAISGPTGETLAREQLEAPGKEQVLQTLSQAASILRKKLGENLASVEKYSALRGVTTSSLPALKAFSLGSKEHLQGKHLQAIPFYQRAVELDQNFASAWAYLGVMYLNTNQLQLAAESVSRAFALRESASELERFEIMNWYHAYVTGDIERRIEVLEQFRQTYPRSGVALTGLFLSYGSLGQLERAEEAAREALRLFPKGSVGYTNHAFALMRLGRLAESRAVLRQMEDSLKPTTQGYWTQFLLDALAGDVAGQQQALERLNQSEEYRGWGLQSEQALFQGRWRQAQELARQAQKLAIRQKNHSVAAAIAVEPALHSALLGMTKSAAQIPLLTSQIQEALALERNRITLSNSALAFALSGNRIQAGALQTELAQRYPQNTLVNLVWLPVLRAALAQYSGQAAEALEALQPVERYEAGADFWPQYLRGLSYLKLRSGKEAATEFRKIIEHRSYAPLSPLWPLAHLGLARAFALTGNLNESKKVYEAFFRLWKEADTDLPILQEAQREAGQLQ